jgi:hypothetical protein
MGILSRLLGRDDFEEYKPKQPKRKRFANIEYERINRWIESRIGVINPEDAGLKLRLEDLLKQEKSKVSYELGKISVTTNGNDTHIAGETMPYKNCLKRLGCKWDSELKCWVAKNKRITEREVYDINLKGLEAYIKNESYRSLFKN